LSFSKVKALLIKNFASLFLFKFKCVCVMISVRIADNGGRGGGKEIERKMEEFNE
jgi:hypothetical protein